jgi:hypothetical protein
MTVKVDCYPVRQGWSKVPIVILFGLILATMLMAVVMQPHAVIKHGSEALSIRDCIDKNGPYQVWQNTLDPNTWYQVCQIEDGRWGLQALAQNGEDMVEKTAFIKGDGSWGALIRYLGKMAVRVTGGLP